MSTSERARRFRQAGTTYLAAGVAVVVLPLAAGQMPPGRLPLPLLLLPGVGFVILFGTVITLAPALWRWPRTVAPTIWLVRLLTITNTGRTLYFLLSAAGVSLQFFQASRLTLAVVRHDPEPLQLVNAGLVGLIALMLARAGWARD